MRHGVVSAGYEGWNIDDWIEALARMGVGTVADVRLHPISRKPGFSKTRLREALSAAGIDYWHLRALGNPKEYRQPFLSGRVEEGRRLYREWLQRIPENPLLEDLAELVAEQVVAVVCVEADPEVCHRQVIIEEVTKMRSVPVVALAA